MQIDGQKNTEECSFLLFEINHEIMELRKMWIKDGCLKWRSASGVYVSREHLWKWMKQL